MRQILHLVAAALVLGLSVEAVGYSSNVELFAPIAVGFVAVGWFVWAALFLSPSGSLVYRYRRELALAVGTTAVAVTLATIASAVVGAGATANFRRAHYDPRTGGVGQSGDDREIGWSPLAAPDIVGQRLQQIDPSRPQVVVVGDSILYGLHLKDEDVATFKMEKKRPDLQFLNLSVSGWSIEQYWLYLRRMFPAVTQPKVVVIGLFTGNDVQLTGREYTPWAHSKPLYKLENDQLVRVNRGGTCADALSQSLLFRALWRKKDVALKLVRLLCDPAELPLGLLEKSIGAMFREIEGLAKERAVKVVWVLLPTRYELTIWSEEDRMKYVSKYGLLRKILRDGGHETYDFYPDLLRSKADLGKVFLEDNAHMSPLGHDLLADALMRYLEEHHHL